MDFEHALLELRGLGRWELLAELRKDPHEDFSSARGVDIGQIEHRAFPRHAKDLVLDAQGTFEVRQVIREEEVSLLCRHADDHRGDGVGLRQFSNPRDHRGEFSRVIILISSHLCFDHNNISIDGLEGVLKTGSGNVPPDSCPVGRDISTAERSDLSGHPIESPRLESHIEFARLRGLEPRPLASASFVVDATDASEARRLSRGVLALAGVTYVLIVLGALVRANGAGLACPDWPLCFGEVIPRFDFKIAFEWSHRALAGSVGIVFVVQSALILRRSALRARMWRGLLVAATLLAAQIVLGGLTVLELLASWTVTSHLVTGNAFALALVLLARRLSTLGDEASTRREPASASQRLTTTLAALLLAIQIVLGGLVSSNYAGLVCPDWPTCMNGEFFPTWSGIQGLHLFHRSVGYACLLAIAAAAWLGQSHPGSRTWLRAATVFAFFQVVVGVANVLLRLPVEVTGLHSALAAGLVCTVGVGLREAWRSGFPN